MVHGEAGLSTIAFRQDFDMTIAVEVFALFSCDFWGLGVGTGWGW